MKRLRTETIEATDLSPILEVEDEDGNWLRDLARVARASDLALRLSTSEDEEPILRYDVATSQWWAGRFVGELRYRSRVLRILPRFGMPTLHRWLSRIWGVRFSTQPGKYETNKVWLWELLARLWASRLISAGKHGPPHRRVREVHVGPVVRGRLNITATAQRLHRGQQVLVSLTPNRRVDAVIGSIISQAYSRLRTELSHVGAERTWLTDRGTDLIDAIRHGSSTGGAYVSHRAACPIRYTPITEGYRPVVDLSLSILRQRPFSSSASGEDDVIGVLLDMAEIWEHYVFQLLRSELIGFEVAHAGRSEQSHSHLVKSCKSGKLMGGLKPDILVRRVVGGACVGVFDAKYKTTTPNRNRASGVLREDLYQIAAYLAAYGKQSRSVPGALIYPINDDDNLAIGELQMQNPWEFASSLGRLSFLGISAVAPLDTAGLSPSERTFLHTVRGILRDGKSE